VTVNLIQPGTVYADRISNIDMRFAKVFRFSGTRAQFGVDIYNLLNTDVATAYNQAFSPTTTTWLTPTAILPARYARFNMQIDF
jgi:hypothetical protein